MKRILYLLCITLVACKDEPRVLFNGVDLKGWHWDVPEMDSSTTVKNPFFVRKGLLVTSGSPGGHLITNDQFSDYTIDFDYRFAGEPGNCGALVHVSQPRRLYGMFPQSVEVQLMSTQAGDFWCIGENIEVPDMEARRGPKENWGVDGDKNRRIPNLTGNIENPPGQWNHMKITCFEDKVKVWLNEQLVNEGFNATAQKGQFALQSEGSEVEFKNILLKEIESL